MKVLYTAVATATGGRQGRVRTSDGALAVDLALPTELGGPGGAATNPEQLFASGYAACFDNAMRRVAREQRTAIGQTAVTAKVGIGRNDAGYYELEVELHVQLPDLQGEVAEQITADAHRICPYSNAVRGNVDVTVVVDPAPDVV
jgi:lipoyl-dependent peroxiredoxin